MDGSKSAGRKSQIISSNTEKRRSAEPPGVSSRSGTRRVTISGGAKHIPDDAEPSLSRQDLDTNFLTMKAAQTAAHKYFNNLKKSDNNPLDLPELCTREVLEKQIHSLKKHAGDYADYVDIDQTYAALQELLLEATAVGDIKYNLQQALRAAGSGGTEFDNFLITNQDLLLFAELLQARVSQGVPPGDSVNQRVFAQLQYCSACKMAETLCSGYLVPDETQGLRELVLIARKGESELKAYLLQKDIRPGVTETLGFDFDDEKLHRYMSMETLKKELNLYCILYREHINNPENETGP